MPIACCFPSRRWAAPPVALLLAAALLLFGGPSDLTARPLTPIRPCRRPRRKASLPLGPRRPHREPRPWLSRRGKRAHSRSGHPGAGSARSERSGSEKETTPGA